jgi:N,N'-diacetylbacillosaminyl-diphospho-undecaprenol alpha-1,3-N-acetylgalactosaminyltransferase
MKIAIVMNDDFSTWRFFRGLIQALINKGIDVHLITPGGPYVPKLVDLGATHQSVAMARFINVHEDIRLLLKLYRLFRAEAFDMVCTITVKPNLYGAIAARLARTKTVVAMIEGLGYPLGEGVTYRQKLLRAIVSKLYWLSCTLCDRVGFSNPDDLALFLNQGLIKKSRAVAFRSMVGINLDEYCPVRVSERDIERLRSELRIENDTIVVVMVVARIVWSKGVREFIEASEISANWSAKPRFLLVGPLDPGAPDAVTEDYLRGKESKRFHWMAFREDIKGLLALSDVVVLPSYYREGVPRVLLEAMAMGRPIVTTDHVGCRETVDEGKNGFLVPTRNSAALATAVQKVVSDPQCREALGRHSRIKAEAEFDESSIIERIVVELYRVSS